MSCRACHVRRRFYTFQAVKLKQLERRLDGMFEPTVADRPIWFVEFMFYKDDAFYVDFLIKLLLRLRQSLERDWRSVAIFASRAVQPDHEFSCRALLGCDQFRRIYLDEVPTNFESLGIGLMNLIVAPDVTLMEGAREFARSLKNLSDVALSTKVAELFEFVIISRRKTTTKEECRPC